MMDIKIDHEDMKRLYEAFVSEKALGTRKECPSPEQLNSLLNTNIKKSKKREMIDHISQCSFCLNEIRIILRALEEGERFSKEIISLLQSQGKVEDKRLFNLLSLRFSWVFVTSIIAIAAVFVIFVMKFPQKHMYRGKGHNQVELVSPIVEIILKPPIIFEWKISGNAEYFVLEIFDETLYPIWQSEKIMNNWLKSPNEALNLLTPQIKYFWMVTAYFQDGSVIESQLKEFILK